MKHGKKPTRELRGVCKVIKIDPAALLKAVGIKTEGV